MIGFLAMALAGPLPATEAMSTLFPCSGGDPPELGCRHASTRNIGYAAAALGFVVVGLSRRKRASTETPARKYRTPLDDLDDQDR